ncbi:unnamed protein product [Kuraishia capsulata CBS 1993]|uniref:RNA helicase n=1 Tax=Kuraishia capsulata CBS 1993 TaxID=1382522 RepID=W6MGQ1_9ASCO|nr:uncharacterized protein KUCA_T00001318001 [Kuraishia capsulata CBS 1993]CDK25349.1 unnamed protein product [Kuraishia capsulata CBS 1993]
MSRGGFDRSKDDGFHRSGQSENKGTGNGHTRGADALHAHTTASTASKPEAQHNTPQNVSNFRRNGNGVNGSNNLVLTDAKAASPSNNILAQNTVQPEISAEEKRRLRQEKLAAWKKKKKEEEDAAEKKTREASLPAKKTFSLKSSVVGRPPVRKFGMVKKSLSKNAFGQDGEEEGPESRLSRSMSPFSKTAAMEEKPSAEDDELESFMSGLKEDEKSRDSGDIDMEDAYEIDDHVEEHDLEEQDPQKLMKELAEKSRKDIPELAASTEPFKKDFYRESSFVTGLTDEEVASLRLTDGITVRGKSAVRPILTWSQLGLPTQLSSVLEEQGFDSPTPIQCEALPNIMKGNDLIGIAKTGSGKTLAFLLPLFRQIIDQRPLRSGEGPLAILMTPTRELAIQIFKECKPFLKNLNLKGCCAYGGAPISQQISEMKKQPEVVVCTPGRMIDLLTANGGRVTNMARVTYLVLDEADRMFDMGFEPQVMKIIKRTRDDRQTVLFSATFPARMEALAKKVLQKPVEILVGSKSVVSDTIEQIVEVTQNDDKFAKTLKILGDFRNRDPDGKVLIFVDRQDGADFLYSKLLERGYPCLSLHGGKTQTDRGATIDEFKSGKVDVLIATSVAARGLDVKGLNLVINYDAPTHMEDYVHRVGRTGRAGNKGRAYTFVTPDQDRFASDIARALELSHQIVPASIQELADQFRQKVKAGKEKFSSGFGGKGLEKLEQIRINNRNMERKAFQDENDEIIPVQEKQADPGETTAAEPALTVSAEGDYKVVPSTENANEFQAKIPLNDLPSKVRWHVTNRDSMSRVIEMSGTSITTKGRYYPPGKGPTTEKDDPKLYLLIEGQTELAVSKAVSLLRESMITELNAAAKEDHKGGKYTIT